MQISLKKAFLLALPLAGLLFTAPAAFARPHHHHHHGWYRRHCRPDYDRDWSGGRRYDDDDYYYRRGGYGGRRYDNDDYYRSRSSSPFYSGQPWWYWYSLQNR